MKLQGLFLLNILANKFDINGIGLYRDKGLTMEVLWLNYWWVLVKLFISTQNRITLQVFSNSLSELDYQTFPAILKSSTKHKHYQSALNQFGYDCKLQSQPLNDKNEDKIKSSKNRKENIIWFNPPFSKNVSNNIGKYFLLLIQKNFPNNNINIIM